MAITQTDIDALDAAIVRSELEAEVDGTRIKYRTMSELFMARDMAVRLLASAATTRRTGTFQFQMVTNRGE